MPHCSTIPSILVILFCCIHTQIAQAHRAHMLQHITNRVSLPVHFLKTYRLHIADTLHTRIFDPHPYSATCAYIRYTPEDTLGVEEQLFRKRRLVHVKRHIEQLCGCSLRINEIPTIAFCMSGGGLRATIMTLGFLQGAQNTGLLDTALYIAGLSGSTWALASWIASGKKLEQHLDGLRFTLMHSMRSLMHPERMHALCKIIISKIIYGQTLSAIDIYGALLTTLLLSDIGEQCLKTTISCSHAHLTAGGLPLPIYTAICGNSSPYEWVEVTPFEIGSSFFKAYIPLWAYGRTFRHGRSINKAPEQTLGYFLGIFGSAFELCLRDALTFTAFHLSRYTAHLPSFLATPLQRLILGIIRSPLSTIRPLPSRLANFLYRFPASTLKNNRGLVLIDAGIDFNLPFPPLLRHDRAVDIIIVFDSSASIQEAPELKAAEKYARRKQLKFPPITYTAITQEPIQVFQDPNDPSVPIVIYCPRITHKHCFPEFDLEHCVQRGYCNTLNFTYTPEQVQTLSMLAQCSFEHCANRIKEIIKQVVQRKRTTK